MTRESRYQLQRTVSRDRIGMGAKEMEKRRRTILCAICIICIHRYVSELFPDTLKVSGVNGKKA